MRITNWFTFVRNVVLSICFLCLTACGGSASDFQSDADKKIFENYNYESTEEALSKGKFFDYADAKYLMLAGYATRDDFETAIKKELEEDFNRNNEIPFYGAESCRKARDNRAAYQQKGKPLSEIQQWDELLVVFCGSGNFQPDAFYRWMPVRYVDISARNPCSPWAEWESGEGGGQKRDLQHSSLTLNTLFELLPKLHSPSAISQSINSLEDLIIKDHLNIGDNYCGSTRGDNKEKFYALSPYDKMQEKKRIIENFRDKLSTTDNQHLKFRTRADLAVAGELTDDGALVFWLTEIPYALFNHDGYCRFKFENDILTQIVDGSPAGGDRLTLTTDSDKYGRSLDATVVSANPGESRRVFRSSPSVWLTIYSVVSGLKIDTDNYLSIDDCQVLLHAQAIEVGSVNPSDPLGLPKEILYFSKKIFDVQEKTKK